MRHLMLATLVIVGMFGGIAAASADGASGTAREAQDMVERGVLLFEDEGAANAFAAINMGPPQFRHHDLYLFVVDATDGLMVANALHHDQIGTDVLGLEDVDGTPIGRNIVEQATAHGVWVDYKYENPMTGEIEPKSS